MYSPFGIQVRFVGVLGSPVDAQACRLPIERDSCSIATIDVRYYAEISRMTIGLWPVHILQVDRHCNVAQVGNSVVALIAIDVVNQLARPLPIHIQPRATMCE